MKTTSLVLWGKRFLFVVLCILIILSPTVLISKPAHAQSPYDDLYTQLKEWRQKWTNYLIEYNSTDDYDREAMNMLKGIRFNNLLTPLYSIPASLSTNDQAKLDDEARRMTGHTFGELVDLAFKTETTVPEFVQTLELVYSVVENLSSGVPPPPTTESTKTTPTSTTTSPITVTTPSTKEITFEIPPQGGDVSFKEPGYDWKPVSPVGQTIPVSDGLAVRTGQGSVVMKDFPGQGDQVSVGQNTEFQIQEQTSVLDLLDGKIRVWLEKKGFIVHTRNSTSAVRGTDFIIDVTPEQTRVLVFEGTVEFSDLEGRGTVLVKAGEYSIVAVGGLPAEPQRMDSTAVFQEYQSLFTSEEEIKAVASNMEKLVKSSESNGFLIFIIIPVIIIVVVIRLVIRRMRRVKMSTPKL